MAKESGGLLVQEQTKSVTEDTQKQSVAAALNAMLDQTGIKNRINEVMGKRAPQFTASMVSLVNADANMKQVFYQAPMTIIQACLRSASLDIPCDNSLGLGYILPFYNGKTKKMEAQFILGYRGLYNLAMRTGAYERLNVCDIRAGELVSFDRLTEDVEIEWLPNGERENAPIVGYMGYFRMINGMEKKIYMTIQEIEKHELDNRKGKNRNPVWNDKFEAMCAKTVLRRLIGKWGALSIDYKTATPSVISAAESIAKGRFDDEDESETLDVELAGSAETDLGIGGEENVND